MVRPAKALTVSPSYAVECCTDPEKAPIGPGAHLAFSSMQGMNDIEHPFTKIFKNDRAGQGKVLSRVKAPALQGVELEDLFTLGKCTGRAIEGLGFGFFGRLVSGFSSRHGQES